MTFEIAQIFASNPHEESIVDCACWGRFRGLGNPELISDLVPSTRHRSARFAGTLSLKPGRDVGMAAATKNKTGHIILSGCMMIIPTAEIKFVGP